MSRKSRLSKKKAEADRDGDALRADEVDSVVREAVERQLAIHYSEHRSGPLPDAEELRRYEEIRPGFANEILEMAKQNQDYTIERDREDREMQRQFLENHQILFARGQKIGCVIAISALAVALVMAFVGAPKEAASIVIATMGILAGVLVYSKWSQPQDTE